jgi:predicted transglutaminase-like cysteine proteinase
MKIKALAGAILCGWMAWVGPASAVEVNGSYNQPKSAREFGKTLAPVGFVSFCSRSPQDCRATGSRAKRVELTPERWNLLFQVNSYVNGKVAPVSDQELYGQPEYWTYPTDAGDCEDYLLLKKRYLERLGFPAAALRITVVLDEHRQGHAVLTVTSDTGDYVLDNRRDDIRRWTDTSYQFLKRQSASNPLEWVALTKQTTNVNGFVAGQNRAGD